MNAWFAVRTNPRCEERASRSIEAAGFAVYAPTVRKTIVHHRTKRVINRDFPLLVGYIFVELVGARPPFGTVRKCDGVKGFVGFADEPSTISDVEMEAVRHLEGSQWLAMDLAMRRRLKLPVPKGRLPQTVNIAKGPLSGFLGRVVDGRDRDAVKVVTALFGRLHEVSFPEADLAPSP